MASVRVESWGRLSLDDHESLPAQRKTDNGVMLPENGGLCLPYGNGRSYGDVCLNPGGGLLEMRTIDRLIDFDDESGVLTCEAGILLKVIQEIFVPRGWMLPVVPGTQLITVGGAIANDIHGKNHHVHGSFGDHVKELVLQRSDGEMIVCSTLNKQDWFNATVGGAGLTGYIVQTSLQLRRISGPWLESQNIAYQHLQEFFELSDGSEEEWEHTVSWIDCLNTKGRGVFMRANHSSDSRKENSNKKRPLGVPFVPPVSFINKLTLRPFNALYYQMERRKKNATVHYVPFFHPLDNVQYWNRIYGPRGFYQYQSVLPREFGVEGVKAMLDVISKSGEGSFLAVLKTFGKKPSCGMLSFPIHGVTLALDFPNRGSRTLQLLASLDDIVRSAKGRIYIAKDARMPRDLFELGYPRLAEFLKYRDPGISSALSRRLMGN